MAGPCGQVCFNRAAGRVYVVGIWVPTGRYGWLIVGIGVNCVDQGVLGLVEGCLEGAWFPCAVVEVEMSLPLGW